MSHPDTGTSPQRESLPRRRLLQVLGGLGGVGLAGGATARRSPDRSVAATGTPSATAADTDWGNYTKVPLDTDTDSPTVLDVAADGRVFYVDRGDRSADDTETVAVIDETDSGTETTTALELEVYGTNNGLKGMVLDPDFATTGWIYLYYAPPSDAIDGSYNRLSRFTVDGDAIDPESETELLRVPVQRETTGHVAGDMAFGPEGELYLATGDATIAFRSDGYTPIDEREGHAVNDAQRTSANTAALGGSILRIVPNEDGSYSVPADNFFTEANGYGEEIERGLVRPEIYTMGHRNPYRTSIDPETGALYWADYGANAASWDAERGPPGIEEFNRATEPGFYGWPYFAGPNVPYRDYDFETGESGDAFDPENPTNDSPRNTGLTDLPPAEGSLIYYPESWDTLLDAPEYADEYLPSEPPFPQLEGVSPMVGPVFRHRDGYDSDRSLPESFDGALFVMDWNGGWIKTVSFDDDGAVAGIDPFLPNTTFAQPMDMAVGPDGALYLVEWGSGDGGSGVYRIEYDPDDGALPPIVGDSPPTDPDGDGRYEDLNGDGEVNYADVVDLFEGFDSSAVRNNPGAYDFDGNGRLDFDDVVTLFKSL